MQKAIAMRTGVSLLFILVWFTALQGQQVIATAGSTLSNSNGSMSFTIGEGLTQAFSKGDKVITQGFQQPNLIVSTLSVVKEIEFTIEAYPNPATDLLNIQVGKEEVNGLKYKLFDLNGKLLKSDKLDASETQVPFMEFRNGIYLLRISDGLRELKTFKIIKQ